MVRDEVNALFSIRVLLIFCNAIPMKQRQEFLIQRDILSTIPLSIFRVMFMFAGHIAISFRKEIKHILPFHQRWSSSRQWHTQQTNRISMCCVYFQVTTIFDSLKCHSVHFCAHIHRIVGPLCLMHTAHSTYIQIQYDSALHTFWVVKRE